MVSILRILSAALLLAYAWHAPLHAADVDTLKVGVQPDGRIVVPTNQILKPAGKQVTFPGRPVDLAFADDGKTLVVKNMRDLVFIDRATGKIKQTLPPSRPSGEVGFSVVGLLVAGRPRLRQRRAGSTSASPSARTAARTPGSRRLTLEQARRSARPPTRPGWRWHDGRALGDLDARQQRPAHRPRPTRQGRAVVPVGVAPYTVCPGRRSALYVSNWGGDPPEEGRPAGASPRARRSASTRAPASPTTAASRSSTADGGSGSRSKTIAVGLHPSGMAAQPGRPVRLRRQRQQRHRLGHRHGDGRGGRDDRLPAGGAAAVRQRLQRPGPQPRRRHALRRQRHQQLRRRRPPGGRARRRASATAGPDEHASPA